MKNKFDFDEFMAKKEPPITGGELLAEIKPLFEDYFCGEIAEEGEYLTYRMPNGQKWKLTAEAV